MMPVAGNDRSTAAAGEDLSEFADADPAIEQINAPQNDPDIALTCSGNFSFAGTSGTVITTSALPGVAVFTEILDQFHLTAAVTAGVIHHIIQSG